MFTCIVVESWVNNYYFVRVRYPCKFLPNVKARRGEWTPAPHRGHSCYANRSAIIISYNIVVELRIYEWKKKNFNQVSTARRYNVTKIWLQVLPSVCARSVHFLRPRGFRISINRGGYFFSVFFFEIPIGISSHGVLVVDNTRIL